jgi:hypothetical protein
MAARELPSVRVRTLCSRPVLPTRAHSPAIAPDAFAPTIADVRRAHARSHASAPGVRARSHASVPRVRARPHASAPGVRARPYQSAPDLTRPRPLARVRAQRGHAFTSGRTRATSARPQSFPVGAPYSRVRPQHYINMFGPLHKSLCS